MSAIAPSGWGSDRKTWGTAGRRSKAVAAGLSMLCLAVAPSGAAQASDRLAEDEIALAGALPDRELDTYRGGFEVGGFMVNFGAEVRTLFEGKELVSLLTFGDQIRGSITTTVKDLATGQQVVVSGADQNSKVIQAITGSTKVTYDFTKGILTTVQNTANNTTVSSSVRMTVGVQNYQSMMRAAQTRSALYNIASQVRNANLRR